MQRMSGADLSCVTSGKAPSDKPAFQPYWGKPAVRNDREGRGNVGIIRSPIRASILPDCGGRLATAVPTANAGMPSLSAGAAAFWGSAGVAVTIG